MDDWAKQKMAALEAAMSKGRKKTAPYAKVDLDMAAKASAAMNCPKAMVYLWLLCQTRRTGNPTTSVANTTMAKYGVSREMKRRALEELEAAGLISVVRSNYKNPIVTLL
jgi:CRP-like cAMP-binding protein